MMHVRAKCRDCVGQCSSADKLYFVYCFGLFMIFCTCPELPTPCITPISLSALEYPVGTFHSLFSLLQEVAWRGMCNGPQNCSEQTWMFQRLCQRERAKCRSSGRGARDGAEHIERNGHLQGCLILLQKWALQTFVPKRFSLAWQCYCKKGQEGKKEINKTPLQG